MSAGLDAVRALADRPPRRLLYLFVLRVHHATRPRDRRTSAPADAPRASISLAQIAQRALAPAMNGCARVAA
ncbi:MAG TPA: hypothetical protein VFT22_45565 [Kofleriaceae bacterium]|nr:hypothetical protein [Kofleriaceae bacterium]